MSDLGPKHVEAVAREAGITTFEARALLASTNPDVLAAFAAVVPWDALVQAGRVRQEIDREACTEWRCDEWSTYYGEPCMNNCRRSGFHDEHECVNGHKVAVDDKWDKRTGESRRYVSEWEASE